MDDNLIANARTFTPLMSWRLLPLSNHLLQPAYGCQKPNLIQMGSTRYRSCPSVHSRRRTTHEASCSAPLRGLYRDAFRAAFPGAVAPGVEAEAMACDCGGARQRQDHGYPRFECPGVL